MSKEIEVPKILLLSTTELEVGGRREGRGKDNSTPYQTKNLTILEEPNHAFSKML